MLVGLTGGIGSGKSEVARRLAELGAVVVDADAVAREVVEPGTPGLAAVVAAFGSGLLGPDGRLDRAALAAIVFADPAARERLEAIVHPLVGDRTAVLFAAAPDGAVVVHDVPLLVEAGLAGRYDAVVVVAATVETRLRRLVAGRGLTPDEARSRIQAQATEQARLAVADFVIHNDASLDALRRRVDEAWSWLTAGGVAAPPIRP